LRFLIGGQEDRTHAEVDDDYCEKEEYNGEILENEVPPHSQIDKAYSTARPKGRTVSGI
jgi:hypothetical protein